MLESSQPTMNYSRVKNYPFVLVMEKFASQGVDAAKALCALTCIDFDFDRPRSHFLEFWPKEKSKLNPSRIAFLEFCLANLPECSLKEELFDFSGDLLQRMILNWNTDCALRLIRAGANIHYLDSMGRSILFSAVDTANLELCRVLLDAGVSPSVCPDFNSSPLILAVSRWYSDIAELLCRSGADLELKDERSITALACAVIDGKENLVKLLVEHGADVGIDAYLKSNFEYESENWPLLCVALSKGHSSIAETLVNSGASVHRATASGVTPLMLAAERGFHRIVERLIGMGADISALDDSKSSALHYAARSDNFRCARALVQAGADTGLQNILLQFPRTIAFGKKYMDTWVELSAGFYEQEGAALRILESPSGGRDSLLSVT